MTMSYLFRRRWALVGATFASVLPLPAAAQTMLHLDEAIALSVGDQPTIEAYGREAEASEQAAVAARSLPDPQLTLGVRDFPVTGGRAFNPTADNFTMYMVGIMREQVRRSKRNAETARLRAEASVNRAEATAQQRRIQREVMLAWIGAVEAEAKQRLLARLIADLKLGHEIMEAGVPTGASTPTLALEMQAEIALAEARLADAQGDEERARAELARWIGNAAQRPVPDTVPTLPVAGDATGMDAFGKHPIIEVAEAQEQAAQRRIDVARVDRKPDISWSLSYGFRPEFGDLVTAQVTIPLQINKVGRQDRRIDEAAARADAARLRAQDARRELDSAYRAALADYRSSAAQLSILDNKAVPSLEASFAAAEARYGAGQGSLEVPLNIVRRYVAITLQSIEERARQARAAAELTYLGQEAVR